jgi:diguanylate cyclase (GGDEF)-like protein
MPHEAPEGGREAGPHQPEDALDGPWGSGITGVLACVLDAAPFGLEVISAGRTIYANPAHRTNDDEAIRTRRFSVSSRGESYDVALSTDESEQFELVRDLMQRAWFDELTGLPNRSLMERSVDALIGSGCPPFGVVFIDVDGFKHVNDYYGHCVGDQLLKRLCERVGAGLRRSDLLARLAGDEFVLLISPFPDIAALAEDVQAICDRIKEPFVIEGHEICASASIGVSVFPDHGTSYDQLLAKADRAMYRGKVGAKGGVTSSNRRSSTRQPSAAGSNSGSGSPSATSASAAPTSQRSICAPARCPASRC